MKQNEIFLASEGDAYFKRNHAAHALRPMDETDPIIGEILHLLVCRQETSDIRKVLEIGCGEGRRLEWLRQNLGSDVFGVEPSAQAVSLACERGVQAHIGTADSLPFDANVFDVVIFGFCLYLCDQQDLFKIACEADRVLKRSGWIVIHDFFAPTMNKRWYHHCSGVYTHKMDYSTLFSWHPAYTCFSHRVVHHVEQTYTDDTNEWVATSVLRKHVIENG